MRLLFFLYFIGFTSFFFAQESQKDSIDMETSESSYIADHKKQFNVKFDISNEITTFEIPQEDVKLNIKPNLNAKYAFVLSYKFASIRLGIRSPISDEDEKNKGKSKFFRIHFKLLFDHWSHNFKYIHNKGYYVVNTEDYVPSEIPVNDFRIQFPDLTSSIFSGNTLYKLNDNYSVRAIESQTEIQIKSAGSFMPGIYYSFYSVKDAGKVKFPEDQIFIRDEYLDVKGFNTVLTAGYYYTFVYRKYWFVNAFLIPGLGADFYKTTNYSTEDTTESSFNDFSYSLSSGLGIGYNGKKIFFGANYTNRISSEKYYNKEVQLQARNDSFHVYLGYRLKAPKSVQKSVDMIEEKIPILNDNNN